MKKIQQFYVVKLSSDRIRSSKYKINLSLKEARQNGEIVSVGQNQTIQSLFSILGKEFNQEEVDALLLERKHLKNKTNSKENIVSLLTLEEKINNILFIPEIISVKIERKQHYAGIIKHGILLNGKRYVRLMCGAGHARRNTVIFISEEYEKPLKEILNNGRNKEQEMVLAKNNAYFALNYSGKLLVSEPYFCVIPDCELKRTERVEFIDDDLKIQEIDKELDFNLFDGQGLISPKMASIWANDLGLDYIPSAFIIRNSFLKGMVCVFDFHRFSEECGNHHIKDVWGNDVNIRNMDVLITASQFKAWSSYGSCREYQDNYRKNNMSWGVTRYTPKKDNDTIFTNYQFVQVLNLDTKEKIESICKQTVNYLDEITKNDADHAILYLLGKLAEEAKDVDIYKKINDNVTKALILNEKMIEDPYIQNHLIHSLNKKIKDSYIGNLLVDGNYTMITFDPYAFCEHLFSLPVKGLLGRDEHYCDYWTRKGTRDVVAMRAPLTWRSEVNKLNLKDTEEMKDWYTYMNNGVVIFNVHGNDMMKMSDGDGDGDICMLTNQKEMVNCAFGGLPIAYEKKKAPKKKIEEENLWETDILAFDSKIGYITNCSTTMYAMLEKYSFSSPEYDEIYKRLKMCRRLQGDAIDAGKGIVTNPFPQHWIKWSKDNSDLDNEIVIDKRPYFMRYLYSDYNKKYVKYNENFDFYCMAHFGISLNELLVKEESPLSEEEKILVQKYKRFNLLLDTSCVMNNICHYMESKVKEIKFTKPKYDASLLAILKDTDIEIDKEKLKQLYTIYKQYKSEKRSFLTLRDDNDEERFKTIEQYNKYIRYEAYKISSSVSELANLAVTICYEIHPADNKTFAWNIFGEGIIKNIEKNKSDRIYVPLLNDNGNIEFLGKKYRREEIQLEKEEDYLLDDF